MVLGICCLISVIWTGFYFSPLLHQYDFDNRPFLKSHLKIIKNPNTNITDTHRIKQTYACLSKMSIFNRNNVYEIMLTDMPDIVQKIRNALSKVHSSAFHKTVSKYWTIIIKILPNHLLIT